MGGRYAKGSRKGSWAKRFQIKASSSSSFGEQQLEQLRAELTKDIERQILAKSSLEKEAAMQIAKDLALKVHRLTASNRRLRAKNWRLKVANWRLRRLRDKPSSDGSAPDSLRLMAEQVNAMKEENVLLNRARFRCPKCG